MAVTLILLSSAGMAQTNPPSNEDRMADAIVKMVPLGRIFEDVAAGDPKWPMQDAPPGAVTDEQLGCMRAELTQEGYRRSKRAEVDAYASANPSRMADDLRLLEGGAADLFGKLVLAGAKSERTGVAVDAQAVLKSSTPEQFLSFMTLLSDPNYAELRKLTGVGNALGVTKSAAENEDAGEQIGSSLAVQQMIKSMSTCKVPLSAIL